MECRSFASRIKASLNGEPVKYIEYIGLATCSYELPTLKEFEVVFVLIITKTFREFKTWEEEVILTEQ